MNINKLMLKAIVLTALMRAIQQDRREPTALETEAFEQFNKDLDALTPEQTDEIDRDIDAVFPDLLAAIDCIVELPRIALA
ncbi:hypothetical protein AWB76_07180 [Caballeronia temeraria]|uniref:Uncharacterized protein n=1 Tax=Caballeronia temeraria TaxID=1777137 RepID=A0A158DMB7_9BURK|nr:hypothetical protein [Caballeronia temeraria]SAK95705.1 hypothetical protein AWB76_07180 [Caballeronia temeraria]